MTGQAGNNRRDAISAMGRILGPEVLASVQNLFRVEQDALAAARGVSVADAAYGDHPRQMLDLYLPDDGGPAPVLLFVHGGGFIRGDKHAADHPYNAHVGRWAAAGGMVGAVMNYRLAPDAMWPAGGEDVIAAIEWVRANVAAHGGDPARIVVMGTSAGAVHVATAVRLRPDLPVRAAVLLSGLYGFTPLDARDTLYYGDADLYPDRMPREAVVETGVPLFVACAEFDPPRFQAETLGLLAARLDRHGAMPRGYIAGGHNHYSMACHIGTADTRLSDEIRSFVRDYTPPGEPA
jgi:acetyl esterase/lipase